MIDKPKTALEALLAFERALDAMTPEEFLEFWKRHPSSGNARYYAALERWLLGPADDKLEAT